MPVGDREFLRVALAGWFRFSFPVVSETTMKNAKSRYIFDGFCHRPFDEETDGWLDEKVMPENSKRLIWRYRSWTCVTRSIGFE